MVKIEASSIGHGLAIMEERAKHHIDTGKPLPLVVLPLSGVIADEVARRTYNNLPLIDVVYREPSTSSSV